MFWHTNKNPLHNCSFQWRTSCLTSLKNRQPQTLYKNCYQYYYLYFDNLLRTFRTGTSTGTGLGILKLKYLKTRPTWNQCEYDWYEPDEGYYRNAWYALNLMSSSTFLLQSLIPLLVDYLGVYHINRYSKRVIGDFELSLGILYKRVLQTGHRWLRVMSGYIISTCTANGS